MYVLIELFVPLSVCMYLLIEVSYFFGHFDVHGASDPPHLVLMQFFNVADAL